MVLKTRKTRLEICETLLAKSRSFQKTKPGVFGPELEEKGRLFKLMTGILSDDLIWIKIKIKTERERDVWGRQNWRRWKVGTI